MNSFEGFIDFYNRKVFSYHMFKFYFYDEINGIKGMRIHSYFSHLKRKREWEAIMLSSQKLLLPPGFASNTPYIE